MVCANIEQSRELFEAFASDNGKWMKAIERDANGNYRLLTTNTGWLWWQAARSAPVVQAAVPEAIEQMAADRYKVVPSHESMFHRWAVVADNGTQHLYIGRDGECQNMARKFMGAFLDGAFVAMQNAAAPKPPETAQLDDINAADISQVFDLKGAA